MPVAGEEHRSQRAPFLSMECRSCRRPIEPDPLVVERLRPRRNAAAFVRADCVYVCDCGMSYSNAKNETHRRQITATAELNVPEVVRADLDEVLGRAANVTNRKSKEWRFCSEGSEDAVTWTVSRWLEQNDRLDVFRGAGESQTPALLLWGAAVSGADADHAAQTLEAVSLEYKEREDGRSEPDITLVWPDLVVIVEAKYHSANTRERNYQHFPRYLRRQDLFAVPCEDVAGAGFYELTRNWVLGNELAENLERDFLLINLGPPALAASAKEFAELLAQTPTRRFTHRTWSSLMPETSRVARDTWFDEYTAAKQLGTV